jgi:pyroglutamyl-peptidase
MKILLTGFKRYATHDVNPSELLINQIEAAGVKKIVFDVSYAKSVEELKKAIRSFKPDFIISLGLSPFREEPTFEEYAYNETKSIQPDEDGVLQNEGKALVEGGPKSLHCPIDLSRLQQVLAAQSISSSISIDPGRFVCNAVYYNALASGIPAVFIHLPLIEDYPLADDLEAIRAVIEYVKGLKK